MGFKPVILATDALLFLLLAIVLGAMWRARHSEPVRAAWREVGRSSAGMAAATLLAAYLVVGLLDSLHYRPALPPAPGATETVYSGEVLSTLDAMLSGLRSRTEKTYSAPLADTLYSKGTVLGRTALRWRSALVAMAGMAVVSGVLMALAPWYHVFGTDKVGQDVLYLTLKSVRTALIIGTLTTLVLLPVALALGVMAGYLGGWVDDAIQYIYTVLNSIPGVLLIAAAVLMMQGVIDRHPEWFATAAERADPRLLALCFILGLTSWTGLARLLRGETLKLRELEYVQAARAFGVSTPLILLRHVLPNVMHIVLIAVVMDFSGLVLAEAVLSYVGIGVDPNTISFGTMINAARMELAREPAVWWSLVAAFAFMFALVLSANLFADAVRDAFDPRRG